MNITVYLGANEGNDPALRRAARELGEEADEQRYRAQAEAIRGALLDEYVSPNGNLTVDTQTGYVLSLYYHVFRSREKLVEYREISRIYVPDTQLRGVD